MTKIAGRALAYRRSQIRVIFDAAARQTDVLSLEIGEPSFVTPAHVIEAAAAAALAGATHYPPTGGLPRLRQLIAEHLESCHGYSPDPNDVVVTAGATTAITALFSCLLAPGDEVLIPTPGFPNLDEMIRFVDGRPVFYSLLAENDYLPSIEELDQRVTARTRIVFINTPTNPTGAVYPADTMKELVEWSSDRGLWLISDEVYDQILLDEAAVHVPAARFSPADHVISVYSFSKRYAMTGWRVGYCVAPSRVAEELRKLELHGSYTSIVGQTAAEAALIGPQTPFADMVLAYRRRLDVATDLISQLSLKAFRPSGAMYMMGDVSATKMRSMDFALRLLAEEAVAVAPGAVFGPGGEGQVRLSLAADEPTLVAALPRIARAIERFAEAPAGA